MNAVSPIAVVRRLALALLVIFAAGAPGLALAQATPEGIWRTISDTDGQPRGLVRLEVREGALTGFAVGSLVAGEDPNATCQKCPGELKGAPMRGLRILWGLRPNPRNPQVYEGGRVLDPDSGNIYNAKVTLSPDGARLTVRGFLGLEALGRSQTWLRDR